MAERERPLVEKAVVRRRLVFVTIVVVASVFAATWTGVSTIGEDALRPATRGGKIGPAATGERPVEQRTSPAAMDVVSAYESMRDDVNPKPRLQLIDAWAREVKAGSDLSLLSHAMVDPEPSVRERAQALFDRELVRR